MILALQSVTRHADAYGMSHYLSPALQTWVASGPGVIFFFLCSWMKFLLIARLCGIEETVLIISLA